MFVFVKNIWKSGREKPLWKVLPGLVGEVSIQVSANKILVKTRLVVRFP